MQVQRKLAVNAVDTLMVPAKALHIEQIKETQLKPPCFFFLCQRHKPLRDKRILITSWHQRRSLPITQQSNCSRAGQW